MLLSERIGNIQKTCGIRPISYETKHFNWIQFKESLLVDGCSFAYKLEQQDQYLIYIVKYFRYTLNDV